MKTGPMFSMAIFGLDFSDPEQQNILCADAIGCRSDSVANQLRLIANLDMPRISHGWRVSPHVSLEL